MSLRRLVLAKGISNYDIELDELRRDNLDEKDVSNLEAILNGMRKIQEIISDIDKRLEELE